MNIYMDFFDYDRALILAINKDTPHDFKEFEFRRNQPLIDVIYDKWKFVVCQSASKDERPDSDDDNEHFEFPANRVGMRALGYDSGAERMGWSVVEGDGETAPEYIDSGIAKLPVTEKTISRIS
jgi:hypothetical protein